MRENRLASERLRLLIINEISDIMTCVREEYEYEGGDEDELLEEYTVLEEVRSRNHWAIFRLRREEA